MAKMKKLALLCMALLTTAALATFAACATDDNDSSSSVEEPAPKAAVKEGENTVTLTAGEAIVTFTPDSVAPYIAAAVDADIEPVEGISVKYFDATANDWVAFPMEDGVSLAADKTVEIKVTATDKTVTSANLVIMKDSEVRMDVVNTIGVDSGEAVEMYLSVEAGKYDFVVTSEDAALGIITGDGTLFTATYENPLEGFTFDDYDFLTIYVTSMDMNGTVATFTVEQWPRLKVGENTVDVAAGKTVKLDLGALYGGIEYTLTWTSDNAKVLMGTTPAEGKTTTFVVMGNVEIFVTTADGKAEEIDFTLELTDSRPIINELGHEYTINVTDGYNGQNVVVVLPAGDYTMTSSGGNAYIMFNDGTDTLSDSGSQNFTILQATLDANGYYEFAVGTYDEEPDEIDITITAVAAD